ncbi:hypothetical protein DFH07DRAFT_964392 [Mycena maculata]|uniref:Uncharacterized protein n=1 Tax=Mycena maculata TaxID=230809 RepID=A0AAD7N2D6_9AGAR|nr:hypothetical protein DFH07DRAFT_964392 [Mycena maculata]
MAITTLESQRRNSVVLLEASRSPAFPKPKSQGAARRPCPAPYESTKRRTAPIPAKWVDPQASRRRRLAAAERAFLTARRIPPLFTHASRFPTRELPPLGLRPCNLDGTDATLLMPGEKVRVRRFICDAKASWTEWQPGRVVQHLPMRAFIGNFGHAYLVEVRCPQSGKQSIEKFAQFIGEIILDGAPVDDSFTAEECAKQRGKADYIYTRIPLERKICGIPYKDVWSPAQILEYVDGEHFLVHTLVGPGAGRKVLVKHALPYTLEAAVACLKNNEIVIGPSGKIFLTDIPTKPLPEQLPETLPKSFLNLPSPAAMEAKPISGPSSTQ